MPRPPYSARGSPQSARKGGEPPTAFDESLYHLSALHDKEVSRLKDEIARLRAALRKGESLSTAADEEKICVEVQAEVERGDTTSRSQFVTDRSQVDSAASKADDLRSDYTPSKDRKVVNAHAVDGPADVEAERLGEANLKQAMGFGFDGNEDDGYGDGDVDFDDDAGDVQGGRRHFRKCLARIRHSRAFSVTSNLALFFALFGKGVVVLCDVPDDPGTDILDFILLLCMLVFASDIVLQALATPRSYLRSLFFWLDVLGTVSISFDISYMLGFLGNLDSGMDTSLARSARAAKVGARAGRMLKLMRLLTVWMSGKPEQKIEASNLLEAKVLSKRMVNILSTKVAILTIVLVLGTPMFSLSLYPMQDLSMQAWSESLEAEYSNAIQYLMLQPNRTSSHHFKEAVMRLEDFYSSLDYVPYKLDGWCEQVTVDGRTVSIPGQSLISMRLSFQEPKRSGNVLTVKVLEHYNHPADCDRDGYIYFDFTRPNQMEAGVDIAVIVFIVLVMGLASQDLNNLIGAMLVKPLEGMLTHAVYIVGQFNISIEGVCSTELDVLSRVLEKFARMTCLSAQTQAISDEDLKELDDESKGVLSDIMAFVREGNELVEKRRLSVSSSAGKVSSWEDAEIVASWNLDVLKYDVKALNDLVMYLFFDSEVKMVGARVWTDTLTFSHFVEAVRASYNDLPYHCYAHAVDVLHVVYRVQCLTRAGEWMGSVEQYALLIAALAHDLGHFGKTNPFLVETQHDLALQYNDKSPLENMHSAKLFAICQKEQTNIFNKADKQQFTTARKVAIGAILHTDNAHHFDTVKEISQFYETVAEICETQASSWSRRLDSQYLEDVLKKKKTDWCQVFLHLADISNPLKPYDICARWAVRVLDEFFAQGDEEKSLGLPVGMLNDRDKVNRPGSQHGFINFLVAPFVTGTVRIFPFLHPLSTQMASNLQEWHDAWVKESSPAVEEISKRDADARKLLDTAKQLRDRYNEKKRSSPSKRSA